VCSGRDGQGRRGARRLVLIADAVPAEHHHRPPPGLHRLCDDAGVCIDVGAHAGNCSPWRGQIRVVRSAGAVASEGACAQIERQPSSGLVEVRFAAMRGPDTQGLGQHRRVQPGDYEQAGHCRLHTEAAVGAGESDQPLIRDTAQKPLHSRVAARSGEREPAQVATAAQTLIIASFTTTGNPTGNRARGHSHARGAGDR
jgi:hypothetical protein